jgi:hypothetical protein
LLVTPVAAADGVVVAAGAAAAGLLATETG